MIRAALEACWLTGSVWLFLFVRGRRAALAGDLHEMRGALTAVGLALDLLPAAGSLSAGAGRAAREELQRAGATLGDLERIVFLRPTPGRDAESTAPTRRTTPARLDVHRELSRLATVWSEAARRQGRELHFEWAGPAVPVVVEGSRRRFSEAVANLLANALLHGGGRVDLIARVVEDRLRIEVADQGPGLPGPAAAIGRRSRGGRHGHGLRNVRGAARALGGELVSAPSGSGARLALLLPASIEAGERGRIGLPLRRANEP